MFRTLKMITYVGRWIERERMVVARLIHELMMVP